MAAKPVLFALLLGAACGGLAAWALSASHADAPAAPGVTRGPGADPASAPAVRLAPGDEPAGAPPVAAGEPTLEGAPEAAENLRRLEQRNAELETRVAELKEEVGALEPEAPDPRVLRFGLPTKETPNFDGADWPALAKNVLEITQVLREIRDEVIAGEQPSPKHLQAVIKLNQPLAVFAVSIQSEMGEANANVAYTHPAVIANLVRAALVQAGDPLTGGQELAIASLGESWERSQAEVAAPASAPELAQLVAEVEAKIAFLEQVKAVLTPAQRALLFQPETEGRLQLDLLSPALVYAMRQPVPGVDRADLEDELLGSLFEQAGLDIEDLSPYRWVATQWLDEIPDVLTPRPRASEYVVFPHVDLVQAQARAQVRAIENILGTGRLGKKEAASLRSVVWILQPFVRPAVQTPPAGN